MNELAPFWFDTDCDRPMLYIMRGVPGSGKTTQVAALLHYLRSVGQTAVVCSADHLFINNNGEYRFDAHYLAWAHNQCQQRFVNAVKYRTKYVVVDNTNLNLRDLEDYVNVAIEHGYLITLVHVQVCDADATFNRQLHGVPRDRWNQMLVDFNTARLDFLHFIGNIGSICELYT